MASVTPRFWTALTFSLVIGVAVGGAPLQAQTCEAPPEVKAAMESARRTPSTPMEERRTAARAVRDEFPTDYFAHRNYQELFFDRGLFSQTIQNEYKKLLDQNPSSALYKSLLARALVGTKTPESIRLMREVLAQDPEYAPARLKLVEIYSAPAFQDEKELKTNAAAYWKLCPNSLSAYNQVTRLDDHEFGIATAARLRSLLEKRQDDDEALGLYGTLWSLEFKAVPLSEQAPVRDRVKKDAEMLRSKVSPKRPFVMTELSEAYKLTGDAEGTKWVVAESSKSGGQANTNAMVLTISMWQRENPFTSGTKREERNARLLQQAEEWIRQWPEEPQPQFEKFSALQMTRDAPLEDTIEAAEQWMKVYDRKPAFMSPYLQVAQFYSQHNMRYAEVADLLDRAMKTLPGDTLAPVSDLYVTSASASGQRSMNLSTLGSAASIYAKIKKYDRARELLNRMEPELASAKPKDGASDSDKRQYAMYEYSYWGAMSAIARADGNKEALLEDERHRVLSNPFSNPTSENYEMKSLQSLWKEVKGTDDGFEAWLGKPVPAVSAKASSLSVSAEGAWTVMEKPLPDFEISDANGKTWTLADLKGKVTLVNLWATWCVPCREELPELQKLFNQVRERKDLVVITLNTDDNPGLIEPFLNESKYTFPVLPASGYVSKLVPALSIPRTWIVDAKGVLRLERIGYGVGGGDWVRDMIAEMEKAR